MDKKRILLVSERVPYPANNGGKLRTLNFVIELSKYFDIDYVTYSQEPINESQREFLKKYCNIFIYEEGLPSKGKHLKAFISGKSGIACAIYSKRMHKKIIELTNENKYEMIWIERLFCMPYVKGINKNNCPKILLNMHDVDSEAVKYFSSIEVNKFKRMYYKFEYKRVLKLEKQSFKKADTIIACSQRDKDVYSSMFSFSKDKWLVANNGVDFNQLNDLPKCKQADKSVLFIGGLDNPCNRDGILWFMNNVWDMVLEKHSDAVLNIVGSGKSISEIENTAKEKRNCNFLGYVEDARESYLSNTCIIVPIRTGSGTRLKIVEAFMYGIPVVSTSIGAEGIPAINEKELFISNDARQFATYICKIFEDKKKVEAMKKDGFVLAKEQYDWNNIVKNIVERIDH